MTLRVPIYIGREIIVDFSAQSFSYVFYFSDCTLGVSEENGSSVNY